MAAMTGRQGAIGLSRSLMTLVHPTHLRPSPLSGQNAFISRSFSAKACSSPRLVPSVRNLYRSSTFKLGDSARAFSLWPSWSQTPPKSSWESRSEAVSPDVMAREAETATNSSSTSTPDIASLETTSGSSIHGIESNISEAVEKVQTLADLGQLSSWPNVRAAQAVLDGLVESTGLPWWATIVLVTLSVRVLVLPLVFRGQSNAIRLANIQPRMQVYMKDISYAKKTGNAMLMSQSATAVQKLMKDNDCSPFRSLITPAVLMPLFMTFFFALRGLAGAGLTSMQTGGLSWFTNLSAPDPYGVLPIVSAGMTLIVIETGAEIGGSGQATPTPQAKYMRNFLRILTVISVPFLWNFPAAVFCFWATNNTFSLLQLLALQSAFVRKTLNLPEKIKHDEDEMPKGKPMGFWEGVGAGKASQQTGSVRASRDSLPSALQSHREMEAGREAALKKIEAIQGGAQTLREAQSPPIVNAGSAVDQKDGETVVFEREETVEGIPVASLSDRQARIDEKKRRVQAARQKRSKQR